MVKFQDMGRGARIQLAQMAKVLGMRFIGYNPVAQQVSVEYQGKGLTYHVNELIAEYRKVTTSA